MNLGNVNVRKTVHCTCSQAAAQGTSRLGVGLEFLNSDYIRAGGVRGHPVNTDISNENNGTNSHFINTRTHSYAVTNLHTNPHIHTFKHIFLESINILNVAECTDEIP